MQFRHSSDSEAEQEEFDDLADNSLLWKNKETRGRQSGILAFVKMKRHRVTV